MSYVQVFDAENGELEALLEGLYQASCGDSGLGSHTAAFRQTLTTVDNPVAGIEAGRSVQVLWVYNNRVNAWQEAIQDHDLQADLEAGQEGQNHDGSPNGNKGRGPLANFPWYSTGEQIHLDKEAVNMLAQLASWNVAQLEGEIAELLAQTIHEVPTAAPSLPESTALRSARSSRECLRTARATSPNPRRSAPAPASRSASRL